MPYTIQDAVNSVYNDFIKKCQKVPEETYQFEILSLLCKGSQLHRESITDYSSTALLQSIMEAAGHSLVEVDASDDISVVFLRKIIRLLLFFYQAKAIKRSEHNDIAKLSEIFQTINLYVLFLVELQAKQEKYGILFVEALKKHLKLFNAQVPEFILSLRPYLDISQVVSSLRTSEEIVEHDYTTKDALALEKKYQVIFTLYAEGINALNTSPEALELLKGEYQHLGFLYLWCYGITREHGFTGEQVNPSKDIQVKASTLAYGAEVFLGFFRRNIVSILVNLYKKMTGADGAKDGFELVRKLKKLLQKNYEYFESQGDKFLEDEIFRPKSLDYIRLIMHFYLVWPQDSKDEIFNRENQFIWECLEKSLLVDDNQARKIGLQLLETIISDEKDRLKKAKLPDLKKYLSVYDKIWNCFLDLYQTLDQYAVHLIKAIFSTIEVLVKDLEAKNLEELGNLLHKRRDICFYKPKWLLSILLEKATTTHKNDSVVRYCLKSFMKLKINIDELQEFVYEGLFKRLNIGMLYRDVELTDDSRFFKVISTFFTTYYNSIPPKALKIHIRKFLNSIKEHTKFQSACIALLLVLKDLNTQEVLLEKEDLATLVDIMKQHVISFNLRKQHQMFQVAISLLFFNTNTEKLELRDIFSLLECFTTEVLDLTYNPAISKEIIWNIATSQSPENNGSLLKELLAQDFNFYYKLFAWFFVKFDLSKLYSDISNKIVLIFKDVQNNSADFLPILKVLRALSIAYEISDSKSFPNNGQKNTDFIEKKIDKKPYNTMLNELLKPFSEPLNTIYRNSYVPRETCLQLLRNFDLFLQVFAQQKDQRTFTYIIQFVDQVFSEVCAYIFLLLNKELIDEETPGHTINEPIASIVYHMLKTSSQSQHLPIKCTLLSHASKFVQDFLNTMRSYLTRESLEASKLSILLLIFNSILTCYTEEMQYSIHFGKSFFVESELFSSAIHFISIVKKIKFTSGFTRAFEDLRQKFMINYFLLISYDPTITSSPEYKTLIGDVVENAQDVVDSHDIYNARNLFSLMKIIYIPYLVSKYNSSETPEEKDLLLRGYKGVFETGFRGLLGSEAYSFKRILAFVEFIFDERILVDADISDSGEVQECMQNLIKECDKRYLLLRGFTNHFLRVLLKHPQIAYRYLKVFKSLIIEREYRGFEAEVYDKMINEKRDEENELMPLIPTIASYYGAYTRLFTFIYLQQFVDILERKVDAVLEKETVEDKERTDIGNMKTFIESLSKLILDENIKGKLNDVVMPYSEPHRKRIHLSQALCVIMKIFTKKMYIQTFQDKLGLSVEYLDYLQMIVWKLLEHNNLPNVRQYHEIFILYILRNFPERVVPQMQKYLQNKTNKTQFLISVAWLTGYYINADVNDPNSESLFTFFFPHVASNIAYARAIAQYFSTEYLRKKSEEYFDHPVLKEFYSCFTYTSLKLNMCKKFEDIIAGFREILDNFSLTALLTTEFDEFGEILHDSVIEQLKMECTDIMAIIKLDDIPPPKKEDLWKLYLSLHAQEANENLRIQEEEGLANFQKKIDIDEELYPNDLLVQTKETQVNENEKMDIIVVATLLEKIPNFGNLTRTCEIFGVNQLVIPNLKMLEDEGFKAVSVTAEKWMNIIEIKEFQLAEYLRYKKMCGYTLVGLEQTRASKSLEKFGFPDKCVLLLGNEKQGTPIKFIEMLDAFIEIPQYGKIRSLNVHISAVICIWECVKQKKGLTAEQKEEKEQ